MGSPSLPCRNDGGDQTAVPCFSRSRKSDIDYSSAKIKDEGRRVTREVFDSIYGARRLHFVFHQSLFVLTEIDAQNPDDFLHYLREVLGGQGQGMKHILFLSTILPVCSITSTTFSRRGMSFTPF